MAMLRVVLPKSIAFLGNEKSSMLKFDRPYLDNWDGGN